jgi:hypothetical protein
MSTLSNPLPIIACGVFRWELEKIRPAVERELGVSLETVFMQPALDVSDEKLEAAVSSAAGAFADRPVGLLYGSACHSDMPRFAGALGAVAPTIPRNCAELLISPAKKRELDATGAPYYLTLGSLKLWREIYCEARGWDNADALVNFGRCDRILLLDTGAVDYTEEEIFSFFEYAQVPVEIIKIDLDYFTDTVLALCKKILSDTAPQVSMLDKP